MKRILEDVIRRSGRLDALVDSMLQRTLGGNRPLTPAELLTQIATDIERSITIGPRGAMFPYNRISIELKAASAQRRSVMQAALSGDLVSATVVERLRQQCQIPDNLRVGLRVTAGDGSAPDTYQIAYRNTGLDTAAQNGMTTVARLTRIDGTAARFSLGEGIFNVGRVSEARGRDGRLIRRNQIVLEGDDASRTVSRVHARIHGSCEGGALAFVLFDDGSRFGSAVVRSGRTYKVQRGSIGFRLKDGDEVHLGRVRLEFRVRARE